MEATRSSFRLSNAGHDSATAMNRGPRPASPWAAGGAAGACRLILLILPLVGVAVPGCKGDSWSWGKKLSLRLDRAADGQDRLASHSPTAPSPATEGTIGSATYLYGTRLMAVRGYGLVVGLAGTGSPRCPPSVHEYLIRELRRAHSAQQPHAKPPQTAEQMLESPNSAVVEVSGAVPAGAAKGHLFDVQVIAVDPDTRSLEGGWLLACDLKIYREVSPAEIIEGRTHARAAGPVFLNPFVAASDGPAAANRREGVVIGGGLNTLDRRLRLVTVLESYETVRQVAIAINRRFGSDPKTADGTSPTNVEILRIPPEYQERIGRFVQLVMHLPLSSSPMLNEARAKALVEEMLRPEAPLEDVGLSLEGIGPSVIPLIQPLYTHARKPVSYYAARTGLRLGDEPAIEAVIGHANDPRSPFCLQAVSELGECGVPRRAGVALRELLAGSDAPVRIMAYEALRNVEAQHPSIRSYAVGRESQNFILDVVSSRGPAMIYARRTGVRRLAIIGDEALALRPPLLYAQPGKPITLTALENGKSISLVRKDEAGNPILGPLQAPLSVPTLVRFLGDDLREDVHGRIEGMGLDYGVVLHVLYRLCAAKAIQADMRWEEPSVENLVGPLAPVGRPESEL